jgi:hypothetical protein
MINHSYNGMNAINKYNTSSTNSNSNFSSNNSNFSSIKHIITPEYKIQLSDIYYSPNLYYLADVITNIYLPDTTENPYYSHITFYIKNHLFDTIYLHSTNNSLIYSTLFNSVSGDTSMAVHSNRTIKVISTIIDNKPSWNVLIN